MRGSCESRNPIRSLDRALELLELLADAGGDMGVTEVARRLEVHKSTASRVLSTLQDHGLVERSPASDKYRLGHGLVLLARAVATELDLARAARPLMQELADGTRETVNLAVLQGDRVVNVDQITASHQVVSVNWVGKETPLHCTSNGKALLAFLPPADRRRILAGPLERLTTRTIADAATLEKQLQRVREEGYAFTLEELEVGLNAVAAPIRDASGSVVAAVSVAGPAYRVPAQRLTELGEMTRTAGAEISRRMGFVPEVGGASGIRPRARGELTPSEKGGEA
jgi:DNA-binding IclR family transcriptional regulator